MDYCIPSAHIIKEETMEYTGSIGVFLVKFNTCLIQVYFLVITSVLQICLFFGLIILLQMNKTVANLFQNQMPSFGCLLLPGGL